MNLFGRRKRQPSRERESQPIPPIQKPIPLLAPLPKPKSSVEVVVDGETVYLNLYNEVVSEPILKPIMTALNQLKQVDVKFLPYESLQLTYRKRHVFQKVIVEINDCKMEIG